MMLNNEVFEVADENTKQLLIFYEMAKAGAIVLDVKNIEHAQIMYGFMQYIKQMKKKSMRDKNKKKLCQLILLQIIQHIK